MLPFFTNPYPNELIYSAIARYHFYSGNIDCKDTLEELFDNRSVIPSVGIGSYFSVLAEKLGAQYSVESLLANHTIYPYYAMFLSKNRQQEIIQDVANDGKGLYTRLGTVAGSICRKNGLYYCVDCARADRLRYGEPYIHREHQLQGIDYCPHHEVPLKKYPITLNVMSRVEFIRFEIEQMDLANIYEIDSYAKIKIHLAKQAYRLLQQPLHLLSRQIVSLKYRGLLRGSKLVTPSNRIRQKALCEKLKHVLPVDFLVQYESKVEVANEYNWLKVLTRNVKRHVHPFRHLLMLYFLEQDIDEFMIDIKIDIGPFGKGPYPCLNRAALHYHKLVISSVEVTRDCKTNDPIGTFKCSCGLIYSRKGLDKSSEDRFRKDRVKEFGHVWQEKLNQLAESDLSFRAIATELGVDSKTVKRYLLNIGEISKKASESSQELLEKYKQDIVKIIQEFPQLTRTLLREKCEKQYIFLYRHNKEWLMGILPSNQKKHHPTIRVDWSKRDQEYVVKIKRICKELLELEKPVRITLTLIGRRLGILANLERHLDKLPKTESLLSEITESVQQFQIRRCCIAIDQMIIKDEPVILWKVQRIAAVKSHHYHEIKPYLDNYIFQKKGVKNNEQTNN